MKILLCGGGTSGHVHPALAIADAVKKKYKDASFLFIGREGGFENRAVTKSALPLKTIKIEGISRKLTLQNIKRVKLAFDAKAEAERIIKDFSPDIAVGTGGYVCWPVIKSAQKLNIPTLIHESNVSPGLVTKLLAAQCDLVLLNYDETKNYLKKGIKTETIGNPLRSDFSKISRSSARKDLGLKDYDIFILSFGGSGGAKKLNDILTDLMAKIFVNTPNLIHIHATGNKYYKEYSKINEVKNRCKTVPFIEDMPKMMKAADIVISRSGAVTLSEIASAGVPAILIPSPNVTNNHQYKNAKMLADASAAIMIEEKDLTEDLLRNKTELLYSDKELRSEMRKRLKKFANPSSAERAVEIIADLCAK